MNADNSSKRLRIALFAPLLAASQRPRTRSCCHRPDLQILLHRECREDIIELRHVVHSQSSEPVRAPTGNIAASAVERDPDPAGSNRCDPIDRLEQRGFAGAIRPDDRDDRSRRNRNRYIVEDHEVFVPRAKGLDLKKGSILAHGHTPATPSLAVPR